MVLVFFVSTGTVGSICPKTAILTALTGQHTSTSVHVCTGKLPYVVNCELSYVPQAKMLAMANIAQMHKLT